MMLAANILGGMSIGAAFLHPPASVFLRRCTPLAISSSVPTRLLRSTAPSPLSIRCAEEATPPPSVSGGRTSAAVLQNQEGNKGARTPRPEKLDLQPPRGTRDFYPEDMRLRNWLFGKWREAARLHGFEEYDAPVLESEALYVRKAGEEVTQQLYNFRDKGDRPVALRPEMTPSLARMILARGKAINLPVKWFSIPQCWRYERMTRGRRREHYQWNMDIWGVAGVEAEAELLGVITSFFRSTGLTSEDVVIRISSREVLAEVLGGLGVPADKFAATCVLVDKLDKVKIDDIRDDMAALGLSEAVVQSILTTLAIRDLDKLQEVLGAGSEAVARLRRLFGLAEACGFREWLAFDASVVRGLAYYTGAVFEASDRAGALRAICGGGRYDKLLETFGGDALPACGFGLGDAVIVELLRDRNLLPDPSANIRVDALVFALGSEQHPAAAAAAARLRAAGVSADLVLDDRKAKWAFKQAERVGAGRVVVIGAEEAARGVARVKTLADGTQVDVPLADLPAIFSAAAAAADAP